MKLEEELQKGPLLGSFEVVQDQTWKNYYYWQVKRLVGVCIHHQGKEGRKDIYQHYWKSTDSAWELSLGLLISSSSTHKNQNRHS